MKYVIKNGSLKSEYKGVSAMTNIRVALCQVNPTVGDTLQNTDKMKRCVLEAENNGAKLVVFPELFISGYPPQDTLLYDGLNRDLENADDAFFRFLRKRSDAAHGGGAIVIWGNVRRGLGQAKLGCGLRNSAKIFIPADTVDGFAAREPRYQDKRRLPNYGVFDELRYFRPGDDEPSKVFSSRNFTFGVTVCEDIWYQQNFLPDFALNGAQVVVNINASPFHIGKPKYREDMIRARAGDNQIFVLYCNMVGGQDGIVFDGDSMVMGPSGNLIARAELFTEEMLYADLDLGEVARARLKDVRLNNIPAPKVETIPFSFHGTDRVLGFSRGQISGVPNDISQVHDALVLMIRDYVKKQGLRGVVVGVSGGIDSAVVAALSVEALGKENVTLISMPSKYSSGGSVDDAKRLSYNLGIYENFVVRPIQDEVDVFLRNHRAKFGEFKNPVTLENIQARVRGNILMMYANDNPGVIVLSTGNKSEVSVGYCTLYGDMVGGFNPLLDVYKTDVYKLARVINKHAGQALIPQATIEKAPSAELRADQKDTDSLPPYPILDSLLRLHIEECMTSDEIIASGFCQDFGLNEDEVRRVARALVRGSEFKRQQGVVGSRISPIAFGIGRRMPIVNKFNL
jgi:NAD+ synthase (glutamine-hydrolysing)